MIDSLINRLLDLYCGVAVLNYMIKGALRHNQRIKNEDGSSIVAWGIDLFVDGCEC